MLELFMAQKYLIFLDIVLLGEILGYWSAFIEAVSSLSTHPSELAKQSFPG